MKRLSNLPRRQRGLSAVGWLAVAAIFGLLVVGFFKVFPMYYGNFKVKAALEALQTDTSIDARSRRAIWDSLNKRLFVDDVRDIKPENVVMKRNDGKTTVTVTYETRDNFVGNLYIGAKFHEEVVIDR